jgi:pentalenene oxygenase
VLVVCHPVLLHHGLVDDQTFDKGGPFYDALRDVLGNGLASCPHGVHRRQRRLTQPAFHHTRLPGYAAVMTEYITALTQNWHDGQRITPLVQMSELAAPIASATLFATTVGHAEADHTHRDLTTLSQGLLRRTFLPRTLLALPTPANRRYTRASARLKATITRIVEDYRHDGVDHGDLLSMLLAARDDDGHGLTDTEIHDQVLIFFVAGFDTIAATLAWALYLLARHPDIQHRLRAETTAVLGGRTATWGDLPKLELTSRIITETLRLYPPGWLLTRTVTTDTNLGGHPVTAGTSLVLSPYLIHHRTDLYPDPHHFNPDRWLNPATTTSRTGYLPFGGGARKCIGDTFALTEATLALATLTTHWHLHPNPGTHPRPALRSTLVPRPVPLRITTHSGIEDDRQVHSPTT